jgi:hypothetical protein
MKRKYKVFLPESEKPITITFNFNSYESLDKELKLKYGEGHIQLIDHNSKVIKIYNQYDTGKGLTYIKKSKNINFKALEDSILSDLKRSEEMAAKAKEYTMSDIEYLVKSGQKIVALNVINKYHPEWTLSEKSKYIETI